MAARGTFTVLKTSLIPPTHPEQHISQHRDRTFEDTYLNSEKTKSECLFISYRIIFVMVSSRILGLLGVCCLASLGLLHLGYPNGRACSRRKEEEKRQDGYQLEDHGHCPKPHILPCPRSDFVLPILPAQPTQLVPPVMRKLPKSRAGDDNKGGRADKWYEVEWKEKD